MAVERRFALIGHGHSLNNITDVVISSVADNDVLQYNASTGQWENTALSSLGSSLDHGALIGLADDDHTQYHNDTRGDARYYTKTLLDAGQLDSRYYTETEVDALTWDASGIVSGTLADARIAETNITQHQGAIDHGSIAGLSDDDHTQYLLADSSRAFANSLTGPTLRLTGTGDVSLSSTTHPLQIGADSSLNLAIDSNEMQARNNGAASGLSINIEGGQVTLGSLSDGRIQTAIGGGVSQFYAGAKITELRTDGLTVRGEGTNDPAGGGAQDAWIALQNAAGQLLGQIGYVNDSGIFTVRAINYGGVMHLNARNSSGVDQLVLYGNPDADARLYYAGRVAVRSLSVGAEVRGPTNPGIGSPQTSNLVFADSVGAGLGLLGFSSSTSLVLKNFNHGGEVILRAETSGGSNIEILVADPEGDTDIYGAGTRNLRVGASTLGFFDSSPISKPTITGSRAGNAALANLLTELANYGLITDSTT